MAPRVYSMKDVAEHHKKDDLWLVINDNVYDTTKWQKTHPGGELFLQGLGGTDATLPFITYHDAPKYKILLQSMCVGTVCDRKQTQLSKDFEELHERLIQDGMFEYDFSFYVKMLSWFALMLAVSIKLLMMKDNLYICAGAVCLGMFWQQFAFFGHDAGHSSITASAKGDWKYGLLVTFFFGVSGQWWKHNHNTHHVFSNSVNWDPTVQHLPFMSLNPSFSQGYWSFYHSKQFQSSAVTQFLLQYQHYLYPIIMGFARFKLYWESFKHVVQFPNVMNRRTEFAALCGFWGWYCILLSCLATWKVRIAVILISHLASGLLHCQITMNHFIMDTFHGRGYDEHPDDFWIKCQLATTADIGCPSWLDWFHGGLQFQVAHHLFPRVPRARLRQLREQYLFPFCKTHNLKYHVTNGFFDTVSQVFNILASEAERIRNGKIIPLKESLLVQMWSMSTEG